jgi:hypothetical protein
MANRAESGFSLTVSTSSDAAREFLRRLAYDADAYEQFARDPVSMLEGVEGVDLNLRDEPLLPPDVKPPPMEQLRAFVETGYPPPHSNPPPYNGGCRMWSILYGIASQTELEESSAQS